MSLTSSRRTVLIRAAQEVSATASTLGCDPRRGESSGRSRFDHDREAERCDDLVCQQHSYPRIIWNLRVVRSILSGWSTLKSDWIIAPTYRGSWSCAGRDVLIWIYRERNVVSIIWERIRAVDGVPGGVEVCAGFAPVERRLLWRWICCVVGWHAIRLRVGFRTAGASKVVRRKESCCGGPADRFVEYRDVVVRPSDLLLLRNQAEGRTGRTLGGEARRP